MTLEDLRAICATLPGTEEDVKWGDDLCFCVGKKMYAVTHLESPEITVKLDGPESAAIWTQRDGIALAKYVGRFHWVTVEPDAAISELELEALIRDSYALIRKKLPKSVRARLG